MSLSVAFNAKSVSGGKNLLDIGHDGVQLFERKHVRLQTTRGLAVETFLMSFPLYPLMPKGV